MSDYSFQKGSYFRKNEALDNVYSGLLSQLGKKSGAGDSLKALQKDFEGYRVMGIQEGNYVIAPVGEQTMGLLNSKEGAALYQSLIIQLPSAEIDKLGLKKDPGLKSKYEPIFKQIEEAAQAQSAKAA
ncbi:MAG: hypothetical protein JW716_00005 [Candidatus Aenigmarchaeota archaeon]|nr:hypothetical protein [Candidatus Aenigmarchaeota archaeon]